MSNPLLKSEQFIRRMETPVDVRPSVITRASALCQRMPSHEQPGQLRLGQVEEWFHGLGGYLQAFRDEFVTAGVVEAKGIGIGLGELGRRRPRDPRLQATTAWAAGIECIGAQLCGPAARQRSRSEQSAAEPAARSPQASAFRVRLESSVPTRTRRTQYDLAVLSSWTLRLRRRRGPPGLARSGSARVPLDRLLRASRRHGGGGCPRCERK